MEFVKKLLDRFIGAKRIYQFADEEYFPEWDRLKPAEKTVVSENVSHRLFRRYWWGVVPADIFVGLLMLGLCAVIFFHIPLPSYIKLGTYTAVVVKNGQAQYYHGTVELGFVVGISLLQMIGWALAWLICVCSWRKDILLSECKKRAVKK